MFKQRTWFVLAIAIVSSAWSFRVSAIDLDWKGQFRSDFDWVVNYSLDSTNLTNDTTRGGYYIPGGGDPSAFFQSLFLKLEPTITVNDNLAIKSEWWVGDPIFGFWGASAPYPSDQRYFFSSQSRGSTITAQRVWGELQTDLGTLIVGRAPLHWGLGLIWNKGTNPRDRYYSTGDMLVFRSKFGSFQFIPSFVRYASGSNIGGACTALVGNFPGVCSTAAGGAGVHDISLAVMYENKDEDFELGLNIIRRFGGTSQDGTYGYYGLQGAVTGFVFNTFDIYGSKKLGPFQISAEIPVVAGGVIGGLGYNAVGVAGEAAWKVSDSIETKVKLGRAPGQPSVSGALSQFNGFYFHPNYKIALIMFNYQLRNFAGPNTFNDDSLSKTRVRSPYDNPLFNAWYFATSGSYTMGRWRLNGNFAIAAATDPAAASGQFFNGWTRRFETYAAGAAQNSFIGWEVDGGVQYKWDDAFQVGLDLGLFLPGAFYRFSNTAIENGNTPVFATAMNATINF